NQLLPRAVSASTRAWVTLAGLLAAAADAACTSKRLMIAAATNSDATAATATVSVVAFAYLCFIGIPPGLGAPSARRHHRDFDHRAPIATGVHALHGRARGQVLLEYLFIACVHRCKGLGVLDISDEAIDFDDLVLFEAARFERAQQLRQCL